MTTNISRQVDLTLNIQSGYSGIASVDTLAVITDESLASGHDFGSGYAKEYSLTELGDIDTDFSANGVTKGIAEAIAGVSPRVKKLYVIKRETQVAGVWTLTFSGAINASDTVTGTINGETVTTAPGDWTTDSDTTLTAYAATIQALDSVTTAVYAASVITITFVAGWEPNIGTFTATGGLAPTITPAEVTPAVTIAGDIDNAVAETETNKWYFLLPTSTNVGVLLSAADKLATLSDRKCMICTSTSADMYDANNTSNIANRLKAAAYRRSASFYHDDSTEYVHARLASRCAAAPPGSISFAYKELQGATAAPLTSAQIGIVHGKYANTYTAISDSISFSEKGVNAKNEDIASVRDVDYLANTLESEMLQLLTSVDKLPFNSVGRGMIQARGDKVVRQMINEGILDPDQTNEFVVPELADISAADKAARLFSGCSLNGSYLNSTLKIAITANISV